jgi:2-keto-4-pentenoate hydratase/2-oxohepta-3-ene-1,7-dioic acid hydratase in catechol pathway
VALLKLFRHGARGHERPGLLDEQGVMRDLGGVLDDLSAQELAPELFERIARLDPARLPEVAAGTRLGVPVAGIGKIVAVGLNYLDHAAETKMRVPSEPILFMKAITALNGPNDDVVAPRGSTKLDHEVELVIVIGRPARSVSESEAPQYIAGYCLGNDVSERSFQLERGGQWTKGKSADTFAPLGPYLVTGGIDPGNLGIWLEVNGEERQRSNTSRMIFGPAKLVSYISEFMSLMPGDVIYTGTPAGVGVARNPQVFLKAGDVITLGADGLGTQRQRIVLS